MTDQRNSISDLLVIRLLVLNYAIEMPNRTFICIKRTCSEVAELCRKMEARRHWKRILRVMPKSDYDAPISGEKWSMVKQILRDPESKVYFDDESELSDVLVITDHSFEGARFGSVNSKLTKYRVHMTNKGIYREYVFSRSYPMTAAVHSKPFKQTHGWLYYKGQLFRVVYFVDGTKYSASMSIKARLRLFCEYPRNHDKYLNNFIEVIAREHENIGYIKTDINKDMIRSPNKLAKAAVYTGGDCDRIAELIGME